MKRSDCLAALGESLATLAARMEPAAAATLAAKLEGVLLNRQETNFYRVKTLAQSLGALVARMEPAPAVETVDRVAQGVVRVLENPHQQANSRLRVLGEPLAALAHSLAALATRMQAGSAARLATNLVLALENTEEKASNRPRALGQSLTALAARLEPAAAAGLATHMLRARENPQVTDPDSLSAWWQSLAALVARVPGADDSQQYVWSGALLRPLSNSSATNADQIHGAAFISACARLDNIALIEILKWPFCVGEAEKIVLAELEKPHRYNTKFDGKVGNLIRQADQRGIPPVILASPARRPTAEAARVELDEIIAQHR